MGWGVIIAALALVWAVFTHFHRRDGGVTAFIDGRINLRVCNNTTRFIIIEHVEYMPSKPRKPFLDKEWRNVPIPPGGYERRSLNVTRANNLIFEPSVHGHGKTRRVRVRIIIPAA